MARPPQYSVARQKTSLICDSSYNSTAPHPRSLLLLSLVFTILCCQYGLSQAFKLGVCIKPFLLWQPYCMKMHPATVIWHNLQAQVDYFLSYRPIYYPLVISLQLRIEFWLAFWIRHLHSARDAYCWTVTAQNACAASLRTRPWHYKFIITLLGPIAAGWRAWMT